MEEHIKNNWHQIYAELGRWRDILTVPWMRYKNTYVPWGCSPTSYWFVSRAILLVAQGQWKPPAKAGLPRHQCCPSCFHVRNSNRPSLCYSSAFSINLGRFYRYPRLPAGSQYKSADNQADKRVSNWQTGSNKNSANNHSCAHNAVSSRMIAVGD